MTEPTVQVPVSLTEQQIRDAIHTAYNERCSHILLPLTDHEWTGIVHVAAEAVFALLSQATPHESGFNCEEDEPSDTRLCTCRKGQEPPPLCGHDTGTRAAIERADLVLGGFVQHDCASSVSVREWYLGELRKLRDALDPFTGRDVTPPSPTTVRQDEPKWSEGSADGG